MGYRLVRRRVAVVIILGLLVGVAPSPSGAAAVPCVALRSPVPGPIITSFSPTGRFSGHWGVDFSAEPGDVIRSSGTGTVSFSGTVAGNRTITIDHGGGLKTSYSYLDERWVGAGSAVGAGQALGTVGAAHEDHGLHFSVRIDGAYVDPLGRLECRPVELSPGLRLVPDVL